MVYKVLMVDDEPLVLAGYKRLLGMHFKMYTAASAKEGLRLLQNRGPFAVVVVDYSMPEMNGVDFTVEARRLVPETVRIMLTGKGNLQVATEALNKGNIFNYLEKPCAKETLLEALVAAIEKYRSAGDVSSILDLEKYKE